MRMSITKDNIQQLDSGRIRKRGWRPHILREAEAMRFVRAHTSLPVPKVLDVEENNSDTVHLTMEFIKGEGLDTAWSKMGVVHQTSVVEKLRQYLAEIRALPQPHPGWIESCSGGPAMDHRIAFAEPFGPLQSQSQFHDLLLDRCKQNGLKSGKLHRYQSCRDKLLDHHSIVFSHADLAAAHILVNPRKGEIVGIVDWGMAGFWPEYWEYRKALYGEFEKEWEEVVNRVMTPYLDELRYDATIEYY